MLHVPLHPMGEVLEHLRQPALVVESHDVESPLARCPKDGRTVRRNGTRTRLDCFPEAEPRSPPKPQLRDLSLVREGADPGALEEVGVVDEADAVESATGGEALHVFFVRKDVAIVLRRVAVDLDSTLDLVL